MASSWLAYLPPHLASDLLAHPDTSPLDRVLRQQAVALFADISGFTPMSEALGQVGPHGTEELSHILNRTFGAMIAIIHTYGGSISKFAGDALTVVFPYQARTKGTTVRRAIQCALDMQTAMTHAAEHTTSAGLFRLAMKIGLGMGSLLTTTVGDPSIRLEYLLAGSAIDHCAAAEQHAPQGTVVIPDALVPLLGQVTTLPLGQSYHQVVQLRRRPSPVVSRPLPVPSIAQVALLRRYLPPTIAERVASGRQGLIDEHRTITTLFVRFAGVDYQDSTSVLHLQSYLCEIVQISDRYGGYLRQVDVGDKGSLYIVLFGAPVAHEDDTERALLCALELRAAAQARMIPTATGITTGQVFCGLIGSARRQEYAAIGDSVNSAARLMSAAHHDQILVDAATRQGISSPLAWTQLPPLVVKGKRAPIAVAALERQQQRSTTRLRAPGYVLPMVGRQAEFAHGLGVLAALPQGHGHVLGVTAEAGMGKSRLVAELMRAAARQPIAYLASECLSYGTNTSYLVWQSLLRGLFALDPSLSSEDQITQVQRTLTHINPVLADHSAVLSPILGLPFAETATTRSMEPNVRKETLESLVVVCLRYWAQQQPLLLVVEDYHWIDPLSDDLLLMVAQRCTDVPLMLLITYRPPTTEQTSSSHRVLQIQHIPQLHELRLEGFGEAETAELIRLKLAHLFDDHSALPHGLLERLTERAQGNPFYIDEFLNLLHDRGIDVRDLHALDQVELPSSLQRLILSRIDQLAEGPKTALKVASIIGRLFRAPWLWQIYPALGAAEQVLQHLTDLRQLDLTQVERSEPELEYLFKHIITREVAYESLALQTRTTLHEQVGQFIEQTYAHELERWLDLLAYHYGHSPNQQKQREYYGRAGQAAKAINNHRTAVDYFERLLPLLPEHEQGDVLVALADSLSTLGHNQRAEHAIQRALTQAEQQHNRVLHAYATHTYGVILTVTGRYDEAQSALNHARQVYTELEDTHSLLLVYNKLSTAKTYQGRYDAARADCEACIQLATAIGQYQALCWALNDLGMICTEQGHYDQAISYYERGIALAEQHNVSMVAVLSGNLGHAYFELGNYPQAFAQHQKRLTLGLPFGRHQDIVYSLGNLGAIYSNIGNYAHARSCYHTVLALLSEPLDPRLIGWIVRNLGTMAHRQGDFVQAEQLYRTAIAVCRAFAVYNNLTEALYRLAEVCLAKRRVSDAMVINTEALNLATQRQLRSIQFSATVLDVRLRFVSEQLTAVAALAQLDQLGRAWTQIAQQAAIAYAAWTITPTPDRAAHAADRYRQLHAQTPRAEYRQRYQEITGMALPEPAPLPEPPPIVHQYTLDLPTFLTHVDALLAAQGARG